ncbi:MAG: beta-aspartyl-peptidase [Spirochaetales bacterium]|nr:beta-aspartyl-peptidase [Spirochaetales bacterium]
MSSITLIENGEVYAPQYLGKKNILIGGEKILEIGSSGSPDISGIDMNVIDASGKIVTPGFIDGHVHICGGGGEGGFRSRTPEISLTDLTLAGVTSVIGVLGTDGTTRTMGNLIAKANGLIEEGISAWVLTGSYQVPVRTVTGSITDDIILIDRIIGTGEIALADHRSSHPDLDSLAKLVSDSRLGGILSGKGGIVNVHMGDSTAMTSLLISLFEETEIPPGQILPTHMNRNPYLFEAAKEYVAKGGYADFTTSTTEQFIKEGEVPAAQALKRMLDEGLPVDRFTMTSDGQGSLPEFDSQGRFLRLGIGSCRSLVATLQSAVLDFDIDLSVALKPFTANPAAIHKLKGKGELKAGNDADILILSRDSLEIDSVIARGQLMVRGGEPVVRGTFE